MAYQKVFRTRVDDDTWRATIDFANTHSGGNISEVIRQALVFFLEDRGAINPEVLKMQRVQNRAEFADRQRVAFDRAVESWRRTRDKELLPLLKSMADGVSFLNLPSDVEHAHYQEVENQLSFRAE